MAVTPAFCCLREYLTECYLIAMKEMETSDMKERTQVQPLDVNGADVTASGKLNIVNAHLKFPKVHLKKPRSSGYLLLALEVDNRRPFFIGASHRKKTLIKKCRELLNIIREKSYVMDVAMFKALLIPPGKGEFLKRREGKFHQARFDVVILIETADYSDIADLKKTEAVVQLEKLAKETSDFLHIATAKNIRRIDAVNHGRQGVFLFNFFYADDVAQNLDIWEYTAGWFEHETKLDNSTLLRTQEDGSRLYSVINHCRWNKLSDILPSLLFKRTFRTYVLANFEANSTAPMPILYKLA